MRIGGGFDDSDTETCSLHSYDEGMSETSDRHKRYRYRKVLLVLLLYMIICIY